MIGNTNLTEFENHFFSNLMKYSDDCLDDINNHYILIQNSYEGDDIKAVNRFITRFNDTLLSHKGKYDLYEKVLRHKYFGNIIKKFRESDILIRACQLGKKDILEWLLPLNIDTCVQDNNGATALMYACQNPELINTIDYLCGDPNCLNIVDKYNQNALFYAINNIDAIRCLMNTSININQLNIDNDSIITYCCKHKTYEPFKVLGISKKLDLNVVNNDGKTAAMYLIEEENAIALKKIINKNMNLCAMDDNKETPISFLFKKFNKYYQNNEHDRIVKIIELIKAIVISDASLNIPIDREGNTPLMYFILIEDWAAVLYLITRKDDIDFNIKNVHGESPITLISKFSQEAFEGIRSRFVLDVGRLMKKFFENATPTSLYAVDENKNNILMRAVYYDSKECVHILSNKYTDLINEVNMNNESILILCAKLGSRNSIEEIIMKKKYIDINRQDNEGNTALHYAVLLNDYFIANLLAFHKADVNIKNNEGQSPLDIAAKDTTMNKYLLKPIYSYEMKKLEKNKGKNSTSLFKKRPTFQPYNENLGNKYKEKYASLLGIKTTTYPIANAKMRTIYYDITIRSYFDFYLDFNNSTDYSFLKEVSNKFEDFIHFN